VHRIAWDQDQGSIPSEHQRKPRRSSPEKDAWIGSPGEGENVNGLLVGKPADCRGIREVLVGETEQTRADDQTR